MKTKQGSCLCGACHYTFEYDNIVTVGACHCTNCRKQSGGVIMGIHGVEDIDMSGCSTLTWYESSEWAKRGFCSTCGSNLFWSMLDGSMVVPFAGSLTNFEDVVLVEEIFYDHKPAFYTFAEDTKKKTGDEVFAEAGA